VDSALDIINAARKDPNLAPYAERMIREARADTTKWRREVLDNEAKEKANAILDAQGPQF
jgi:hypothetical protein